jgi:RimJ/RimL family protein N-acetyltransferase
MIREADLMSLTYLAHNMRPRDKQELSETRDMVDPSDIAIDAYRSQWAAVASGSDFQPCLAVGAKVAHSGTVTVWGFGTNQYRRGIVEMTKHCRDVMIPAIISKGFHRAQCLVHPENVGSQNWLQKLGFYSEATLRGFGSSRQDMLLFAWVLDEPTRDLD